MLRSKLGRGALIFLSALIIGVIFQIDFLLVGAGLTTTIAGPVILAFPIGHIGSALIWVGHLKLHRSKKGGLHDVKKSDANPMPSILEMVLRIAISTIGILYLAFSRAGTLPQNLASIASEPNFLVIYTLSATLAVGIHLALWSLESTGASCQVPRLGKVNFGRHVIRMIAPFLGLSALLHFALFAYDSWTKDVNASMIVLIVMALAAASAFVSSLIIRRYLFAVVLRAAGDAVDYFTGKYDSKYLPKGR